MTYKVNKKMSSESVFGMIWTHDDDDDDECVTSKWIQYDKPSMVGYETKLSENLCVSDRRPKRKLTRNGTLL